MKITINGNEVKNPLIRLAIGLLGALVSFIVFALALFIVLPVIWFGVLMVLALVIGLVTAMPRVIHRIRIIQQEKDRLP